MHLTTSVGARAVVLVEGHSDRSALEALAVRRGVALDAEGIAVVPMGGASNAGHYLNQFGPPGLDLILAGLYDAAEVGYFRRGLERAGLLPRFEQSRSALGLSERSRTEMEALGFYVCVTDLEDELIRALDVGVVLEIFEAEGELGSFRTFQKQPAHQANSPAAQLHRFLGTRSGRKIRYGRLLVEALDLSRVPRSLDLALAHVTNLG
ncbi:MAG TPA: TOPRIM nucleotidyl transferase/hydrolase domain-containing protein [Kineosporiaceae bacterium]|nr:TOPRIM nucleotidyl transferase/hydrolase domain-containing protein [Kineosporiaceae bacterium]